MHTVVSSKHVDKGYLSVYLAFIFALQSNCNNDCKCKFKLGLKVKNVSIYIHFLAKLCQKVY